MTGSFEDRFTLHPRDFRKEEAQTTTTETQHRIRFTNTIDLSQQRALLIDLIKHMIHIAQ